MGGYFYLFLTLGGSVGYLGIKLIDYHFRLKAAERRLMMVDDKLEDGFDLTTDRFRFTADALERLNLNMAKLDKRLTEQERALILHVNGRLGAVMMEDDEEGTESGLNRIVDKKKLH